ncbi:hypothetical protein ACFFNY_25565 [Paenibacillus hodogayensis]|uniref:Uncharacterized protein n=1 Tax=Paenibacillus hodogayensis TaxID=279208 RepID=A0ABV5W400_9BACL
MITKKRIAWIWLLIFVLVQPVFFGRETIGWAKDVVNDTFDNMAAGSVPTGWTTVTTGGAVTVENVPDATNRSARISKTSSANDASATRTFTPFSGTATVEARVRAEQTAGWVNALYIGSSKGSWAASIVFNGGNIQIYNGSVSTTVQAVTAGAWYDLKLVMDTNANTFDLYVNGSLTNAQVGFRSPATNISKLTIGIGSGHTGTFYFDSIKVYKANPQNSASFTFSGASGYYAVNVAYTEPGSTNNSEFTLKQNGKEIDYWKGQYGDAASHIRKAKEYWYVGNGDTFVVEGDFDQTVDVDVRFADAVPRVLDRGHLIDDKYWNKDAELPSSWTVDESGGTVRILDMPVLSYGKALKFNDTSASSSVAGQRRFLKQSAGQIVLEYKFMMPSKADGVSWELRSGTTTAVKIMTSGGNIAYEDAGGSAVTLLAGYSANVLYGVKVVADLNAQTADIYVNGATYAADGVPFRNAAGELDNFYVHTSASGLATMYLNAVELYKGYLVYDDFLSAAAGSAPSVWTVSGGGGSGTVETIRSDLPHENNSFRFNDTSTSANVSLGRSFTAQEAKITAEYSFMLPEKKDGMKAELRSGGASAVTIATYGGDIGYEDALGTFVSVWSNYKANVWYDMRVVANPVTNKVDIYVNKVLKASQVSFRSAAANLDAVAFATSMNGTGIWWVDDIAVFAGEYESAVPEPEPVSVVSPYIIGVQGFGGYREGQHFGYDALKPYDNRLPLYGYYEDGNPEVADWMIKDMVEHGISLYYDCWYRPPGSEGFPIKSSRNGASLNDGFLNAKYKDRIHFAIMFENGTGVKDAADFKTNVLNFWIEHYFKNPSYLKIDNKPVIGVYKYDKLNTELGGNTATVFDEVEAALRAEGFDGAIFIAENRGTAATAQTIRDMGYDYTYSYTWSTGDMALQQSRLTTQKGWNIIDPIPVLTQGWGDEPWGGSRKTNVPLTDWEAGLTWLRDSFMPGYAPTSLGSRLILLDNWSELSEGHTLMPSNLAGFGYLDAIRRVFTNGGSHTDLTPHDAGLGPYDQLTPILW